MVVRVFVHIAYSAPFVLELPQGDDGAAPTPTPAQIAQHCIDCYNELYDYRSPYVLRPALVGRLADGSVLVRLVRVGDAGQGGHPQTAALQDQVPVYAEPECEPGNPVLVDGRVASTPVRAGLFAQPRILLRLASLNRIVITLTDPTADDPYTENAFLMCYRTVTSADALLRKLIERFRVPHPSSTSSAERLEHFAALVPAVQLRVCRVLWNWMDVCPFDFQEGRTSEALDHFICRTLVEAGHTQAHNELLSKLSTAMVAAATTYNHARSAPSGRRQLEQFSAEDIADNLTGMAAEIFKRFDAREFLGQPWAKRKEAAPNVTALIALFNRISNWVASCILQCPEIRARKRVLALFISVLQHLRSSCNYDGMFAVNGGLLGHPVHRLRFTIEELSSSSAKTWKEICDLMRQNDNSQLYRSTVASASQPVIPYLGLFLKDLTFTEDGNGKIVNELVNFKRITMIYDLVAEVLRHRQFAWTKPIDPSFEQMLLTHPIMDERRMTALSLALEPKQADRSQIA